MQKVLDKIIQYIYNHFITPTTKLDQYGRLRNLSVYDWFEYDRTEIARIIRTKWSSVLVSRGRVGGRRVHIRT